MEIVLKGKIQDSALVVKALSHFLKKNRMLRKLVNSSNLASIGYDSLFKILEIQFHSSGIYQYFNIPFYIYEGLMSAESHGKYHAKFIKKNYAFKKIT